MSFDKRHERWTRVVVLHSTGADGQTETHMSEFGDSKW